MIPRRHIFSEHGRLRISADLEKNTLLIGRDVQFRGVDHKEKRDEYYKLLSYHKCNKCRGDVRIVALDETPTPFRQWMLEDALGAGMSNISVQKIGTSHVVVAVGAMHQNRMCNQLIAALEPRGAYAAISTLLEGCSQWPARERQRIRTALDKLKTCDQALLNKRLPQNMMVTGFRPILSIIDDKVRSMYSEKLIVLRWDNMPPARLKVPRYALALVEACQKRGKPLTVPPAAGHTS